MKLIFALMLAGIGLAAKEHGSIFLFLILMLPITYIFGKWVYQISNSSLQIIDEDTFRSRGVKIHFDRSNDKVLFDFGEKKSELPVRGLSFSIKKQTRSVTESKVASGFVGGQFTTFRTGDFITYDKDTGQALVRVTRDKELVGSFEMPNGRINDLQKLVNHIQKRVLEINSIHLEEMKQAKIKEEEEKIKAEEERIKAEEERIKAKALQKVRIKEKAENNILEFIAKTGAKNPFYTYNYFMADGELMWAIVADRDGAGGAIFENGKGEWIGSWRGSEVAVTTDGLAIKVDDQKYRTENLSERRFTMPVSPHDKVIEWSDRIKILSEK